MLITDITRHRRAEAALRDSEERLAKFMHASAEGIVFHKDGLITDANPPLLALLGHTLDELLGQPALDFVAPDQRERVAAVMTAGAEISYDTAVLHRDGTRLPVEFIVRTMQYQGERLRMTIVRDLRDHIEARAAHPLPGAPRRADRPAQPHRLHRARGRHCCRRPARPARGWRCCSSTSTTSSASTTRSATWWATRCCRRWRSASPARCAPATWCRASAATSSWCC